MKRVIILGMIACSLLITSTFFVTADDQISYTDVENDVSTIDGDPIDLPNLDIIAVSSIKTGDEVELSLTVVDDGEIENSDIVAYTIYLTTDLDEYMVIYAGGDLEITDSVGGYIDANDYIISGNELKVSFDLADSDEDFLELLAVTLHATEFYIDQCPDDIFFNLDVDTGGPYTGKVDVPIQFSGSVENGDSEYGWLWDFGDGYDSEEQNPTHAYDEPGTYDVSVYVIDEVNADEGIGTTTVTITADGSSGNGDSNSDDSNSGSGLIIFAALIVIIVIVGVAVLIFVIRR
jgi:hypothetical protein